MVKVKRHKLGAHARLYELYEHSRIDDITFMSLFFALYANWPGVFDKEVEDILKDIFILLDDRPTLETENDKFPESVRIRVLELMSQLNHLYRSAMGWE